MAVNFMKIRNGISFAPGLASAPSNPVNGDIYFDSGLGKFQKYENGAWGPLGSGSGSGVNYILNSDFEVDTSGYGTYADAAGVAPVDGTGGSPSVTIARTTSNPLRQTGSGQLIKDAANRQGEGWNYPFTIDAADKAKILSIRFDYILDSGTFNAGTASVDSDIEMWVYDITNSKLIPVTPYKLVSNSTLTPQSFSGIFQSSATSTSYRLLWHIPTTNTAAWTLKIDNVQVGPQPVLSAPNVGDEIVYPFVIGATTTPPTLPSVVDYNKATYREVGDCIDIDFTYYVSNLSGASAGSGVYLFPLPAGFSADLTKVSASTNSVNATKVGSFSFYSQSQAKFFFGFVFLYDANNMAAVAFTDNFNPQSVGSANYAPTTDAYAYNIQARIPIAGQSSNTITGNDADARIVAAHVGLTSSYAVGVNAAIKYDTVDFDTHAGYNPSTGEYKVPVSGKYRISSTGIASNAFSTYVAKNGSNVAFLMTVPTSSQIGSGSVTLNLVAGDLIALYSDSNVTVTGQVPFQAQFNIEKISGPALPLATDKVAFLATAGGATIPFTPANTNVKVPLDTVEFDTHNGFNTSLNRYYVPVSGLYNFSVQLRINGGGAAAEIRAILAVNTFVHTEFNHNKANTGGDGVQGSINIELKAGDFVEMYFFDNTGSNSAPPGTHSVFMSAFLVK